MSYLCFMQNDTKYSLKLLSNVHEAVNNSFEYDFSLRQLAHLINRQSKEIKDALEAKNGDDGISVDNFINEIAKKITGMDFPLKGAPEHHRRRFYAKYNVKHGSYFADTERIGI